MRGSRLPLAMLALVAAAAVAGGILGLSGVGRGGPPGPESSGVVPGSLGPPASLSPGATPLVRIDRSLLAVLPATVDGHSVLESSEGDADASTNSSLARIADSAVGALAIDPGPGDFVLALVVRLKPDVLDDAGFRNWRDNYDAGACSATGVSGHAQSQIGGRTVYVATCGGNAPIHTYHTWIAASGLLISAASGGSRDLGELLFESLRP
jgi:hypothetical protein